MINAFVFNRLPLGKAVFLLLSDTLFIILQLIKNNYG